MQQTAFRLALDTTTLVQVQVPEVAPDMEYACTELVLFAILLGRVASLRTAVFYTTRTVPTAAAAVITTDSTPLHVY